MSVRVELDQQHGVFTCLDWVTGKVFMNLPTEETISAITVKMEGIVRTRLDPPVIEGTGPEMKRDKRRTETEIHRVLYLVQTVWPPEHLRENAEKGFTLKPGEYEYPFRIRIPINSSCTSGAGVGGGLLGKLTFENGNLDFAKEAENHIKGTLPPSLSCVPGDIATIRYFLKVTVNRPKLFKTNLRSIDPFVFLPLEPPRPPQTTRETFAKRRHEFIPLPSPSSPKKSIFSSMFKSSSSSSSHSSEKTPPILFTLEARLPSPPIIVPTDPIPLRLLITKLAPFMDVISMRSIAVSLIAITKVRAHQWTREESEVVSIVSVADLHVPICGAETRVEEPVEVEGGLWRGRAIPDTVPPAFVSCAVSREYKLQVNVGLSRGREEHIDVLSLLLPLNVYSGISPPPQLLQQLPPSNSSIPPPSPTTSKLPPQLPARKPVPVSHASSTLHIPGAYPAKTSKSANASPVGSPSSSPAFGAWPQEKRPRSSHEVGSSSSAGTGYQQYQQYQQQGQQMGLYQHQPHQPLYPQQMGQYPPPSPSSPSSPSWQEGITPGTPGLGPHITSSSGGMDTDPLPPPPTYEDALMDEIGPVDGGRRRYTYRQGEGYFGARDEEGETAR
ncbi:hypothetical protein EX30DRAFT_356280 [Ascodesmis nigricans]|uniref:Arrestin-like N-terminal domain-containing protein n=1 Tax=Ascodesmis nigricans TaxID=341454 RepID=A0A4S2ML14_9PEZI|nr:hypothetical protein EX30DRAFT_356280 [Ascodesmis nigricans]